MDYHVMWFEVCPNCKPRNSGFTVENKLDGTVVQKFECAECNHTLERKYESSINNGSAFWGKARQLELFESYKEIL